MTSTGQIDRATGSVAWETILRRERLIISGCLAAIALVAWIYLLHMKKAMQGMDMSGMPSMDMPGMVMPQTAKWGFATILALFVMWAVMMVAMMVPSAAPMILTFLSVNQRRRMNARPFVPVGIFLGGYLTAWIAYSALAAVAQWRLHEAALLSSTMAATSPALGGGVLIAAGLFQWSPYKHACLAHCRSPLSFLMSEWREGSAGALVMGVRHGTVCVGCCWVLMALLFVAGVMNLLWVAAISLFVMAEKIVARGEWIARLGGMAMVTAGLAVIARRF